MKHFIWLLVTFLSTSLSLLSQGIETTNQLSEDNKSSVAIEDAKNIININLNVTDSIDIGALDSIITAIDSAVNNRYTSKIYGHDIFRKDSTQTFQPNNIIKIPDAYFLGSGDELTISIFGLSQFDGQYIINSKGFIQPTAMPKIFLKGMTWGQAKNLLARRFGNYYTFRKEQFAVSLTKPRTITVNIFGEVERPGSYNLEATNTAFNALIAAGGPTETGSVREILITNGSQQRNLDVYELMQNPISQFEFYLEDNIIIQVPSAKNVVEISGAVRRPMQYEIEGKEGMHELIQYAGGLSANAVLEVVQIRRYSAGKQVILDVNIKDILNAKKSYSLENGDQVLIRSIEDKLDNAVFIEGAVEMPGEYSLESTERVSDLIKKSVLKRDARKDVSFLVRLNPDSTLKLIQVNLNDVLGSRGESQDHLLQANDKLVINSQQEYTDKIKLKVVGAVRNEIEYPFDPDNSITLEQAILLAGGLDPEAAEEGYIIRRNPNNRKERAYLKINVLEAISNPKGAANIKVEPWDEIVVLERSIYTDIDTVTISGAVRVPNSFQFDESMSLRDLITLGGGLSSKASGKLDVYRVQMNKNEQTRTTVTSIEVDEDSNIIDGPSDFALRPYDQIVVRKVAAFAKQAFVSIEGEVLYPGEYALLKENEKLSSLIRRAGGLREAADTEGAKVYRLADGRDSMENEITYQLITNLHLGLSSENSKGNFILSEGDRLFIPKKDEMVYIDVRNTRSHELFPEKYDDKDRIGIQHSPDKTAKWYLQEYTGGIASNVNSKNVTVEYANGAVKRVKSFWPFKKYPKPGKGSIIAVGRDQTQISKSKEEEQVRSYPKTNKGVILYIDKNGELLEKPPSEVKQGTQE